MSLKELMENQRNNVKRLKVNVVEEIRRGLYLIEDESTAALFEAVEEHCQLIEVNKALNIVKPVLKSKNCIKLKSHLYAPQKSKKIEIEKDNKIIIEKLRNDVKKEGKGRIDSKIHEYKDRVRRSTKIDFIQCNRVCPFKTRRKQLLVCQ